MILPPKMTGYFRPAPHLWLLLMSVLVSFVAPIFMICADGAANGGYSTVYTPSLPIALVFVAGFWFVSFEVIGFCMWVYYQWKRGAAS